MNPNALKAVIKVKKLKEAAKAVELAQAAKAYQSNLEKLNSLKEYFEISIQNLSNQDANSLHLRDMYYDFMQNLEQAISIQETVLNHSIEDRVLKSKEYEQAKNHVEKMIDKLEGFTQEIDMQSSKREDQLAIDQYVISKSLSKNDD